MRKIGKFMIAMLRKHLLVKSKLDKKSIKDCLNILIQGSMARVEDELYKSVLRSPVLDSQVQKRRSLKWKSFPKRPATFGKLLQTIYFDLIGPCIFKPEKSLFRFLIITVLKILNTKRFNIRIVSI